MLRQVPDVRTDGLSGSSLARTSGRRGAVWPTFASRHDLGVGGLEELNQRLVGGGVVDEEHAMVIGAVQPLEQR